MKMYTVGMIILLFLTCKWFNDSDKLLSPNNLDQKDSLCTNLISKYKNAYPEFIYEVDSNLIVWNDGTKMIFDDGKLEKTFEQKMQNPDLEDQISILYPKDKNFQPLQENFDPGRIRYEPFFKKMYGSDEKEVVKNLVAINWMPKTINKKIWITSINGIDKKLTEISKKLDELPEEYKKYVVDIGGTYSWRYIAGTNRLSTHSYGIAIDINIKYANYWKWDETNGKVKYRNQIPYVIVGIFEKYGFIWGGKWYHYDTMHFEYRPELLYN